LQRACQLLEPVGGDVRAPVLVILDGADADAERPGDAALRYVAVFAHFMQTFAGSMVGIVHGLHLF
jgi:hypothetical protein